MPSPDFLSIGYVSFDIHLEADGSRSRPEPGGAVAFSALTAHNLGFERVGMVTRAGPDYPVRKIAGKIECRVALSDVTTLFEDDYSSGHRLQRLVSSAGPVPRELVGEDWQRPRLLVAGPLVDELPLDCLEWFEPGYSCLIAQGWFRRVGSDGLISHTAPDVGRIAGTWDLIVLSEQEAAVVGDLTEWRRVCRVLAVTRGVRGALVMEGGREVEIPAIPASRFVDSTGAGDVWAAAFSIRYVESGSLAEAGRFAAAAAAICVSRKGLRGVPRSREEVERLL
jgi:sugar/nucleoside kinase (ribokinase family)